MQKIDNFLGKSKLNFWTKNEDVEQCDLTAITEMLTLTGKLNFFVRNM